MNERDSDDAKRPPLKKKITSPSFFTGNEVIDIFLPLIGPECFAVYTYLKRKEYRNPSLRHSVREVASAMDRSSSTVSRELQILEHVRLVRLIRFAGNKASECELLDSVEAANLFGAVYHSRTVSWSLPTEAKERLEGEIKAIRQRQQGKSLLKALPGAPNPCGNLPFSVSQRNAGVSPKKRQRRTRETQTGSHLIREERRIEDVPSPTPSHNGEMWKSKNHANEDEPDPDPNSDLRWARVKFTGVLKDIRDHLFDRPNRPSPHLANGFADWQEFGFDSLVVERTAWRGKVLTLVLSASDPAAAQRGLEKYRRKCDESLRKWYECEVRVKQVEARRQRWAAGEDAAES